MRVARPSSMVIRTPQASGQSCGQAAWTTRFIKSVPSCQYSVLSTQKTGIWALATGDWVPILLEFQHFLLFALAHLFHLLNFVVGELLNFIECAFLVVFGNFLVLNRLLDGLVAVAADVANRGAMLFENPVQVLDHVLAALFGERRHGHPHHLA